MRNAHPVLAALIAVLLTGCMGLHRDVVQFDHLSDCPKQSASNLAATQNELGRLSETLTLSCALSFLRKSNDPSLRAGPLGSRLCFHLAERESNQGKRERLAAEGVDFAETAIANGGDGQGSVHYYMAANLGLAVREHLSLAVENLGRLEGEMKRALALSPDIDHGGPMRLLGMLYLKAPAWPNGIGDRDKAYDLLEEAARKHPDHPLNHLFFAQVIWDRDDEGAAVQVKNEITTGLKLLQEGNWGYSKEPWKKEFSEFQQEIGETGLANEKPMARAN